MTNILPSAENAIRTAVIHEPVDAFVGSAFSTFRTVEFLEAAGEGVLPSGLNAIIRRERDVCGLYQRLLPSDVLSRGSNSDFAYSHSLVQAALLVGRVVFNRGVNLITAAGSQFTVAIPRPPTGHDARR